MFYKKGVRNFSENLQESTCAKVSFLINSLLKKRLWHRCFSVDFAKFLRTPFLQNTSGGCFWMKQKFKNPFWLTPFHATGFFLYPLKSSENLWFSDVFRGCRKRPMEWNGIKSYLNFTKLVHFKLVQVVILHFGNKTIDSVASFQISLGSQSQSLDNYLLKVNNRNIRTRCEICPKLTIKTPIRR